MRQDGQNILQKALSADNGSRATRTTPVPNRASGSKPATDEEEDETSDSDTTPDEDDPQDQDDPQNQDNPQDEDSPKAIDDPQSGGNSQEEDDE